MSGRSERGGKGRQLRTILNSNLDRNLLFKIDYLVIVFFDFNVRPLNPAQDPSPLPGILAGKKI